jgi:mono/diheme cytochrome c family protein
MNMPRMRNVIPLALLASAALASAPALWAQETAEAPLTGETGDELFRTYCASCHGRSAKGDGPISEHLRSRPADLTLIARRAGGKFDTEKVHRIIDGRQPVSGHGGPDMPVWGDAFKRAGRTGTEDAVSARIRSIVEHLRSLQVLPARLVPPARPAPQDDAKGGGR